MEPIQDEKKRNRRHKITKVLLVTVVVPIMVTALHTLAGNFSQNPYGIITTITDGILFSHVLLFIYEKHIEHRYPNPSKNKEEILKMKFEIEQIKQVLDDAGITGKSEIEVTATVNREVIQTILNEKAE